MPDILSIKVQPREVTGKKVKALRRRGLTPGVIYGQRSDVRPIQVEEHDLGRFLTYVSASSLINVEVAGEDQPRPAIIRDVQRHILTRRIEHFDFMQVDLMEKVRVSVPIVLVGEAPATVRGVVEGAAEEEETVRGVLIQGLASLEVECLPTDIPGEIAVDVSGLQEVDDGIQVGDIDIPESVTVLSPPDQMIARIIAERPEEEEEIPVEAPLEEVEVVTERRGREPEERETQEPEPEEGEEE